MKNSLFINVLGYLLGIAIFIFVVCILYWIISTLIFVHNFSQIFN